jgi:hypothetical protein
MTIFLDRRLMRNRGDGKHEHILNADDEAAAGKTSFMEEGGAHKTSLIDPRKKGFLIEEQQLQKLIEEIVQQSKVPLTLYPSI